MAFEQSAFQPIHTVTLNVSASTANISVQDRRQPRHARLYNGGSVMVFVETGDTNVSAMTSASMPLPPGAIEIISITDTNIAAVTASGAALLYITLGVGV